MNRFGQFISVVCVFLFAHGSYAQQKYWVFFKDKESAATHTFLSPATLMNRSRLALSPNQFSDLPVTASYLGVIKEYGHVESVSRWLNAASVILGEAEMEHVRQLNFVARVSPIRREIQNTMRGESIDYYHVLKKVNIEAFTREGLSGKGVTVGVIDGRFAQARQSPNLVRVFEEDRIKNTKDFISPKTGDFYQPGPDPADMHGTLVWQLIAGDNPSARTRLGAAYDASFVLARTDDTDKEYRGEEDFLISAMEWMDSLGVRLVNISLGYSLAFTDRQEDHKPFEMDGSTTAVAKAAAIAVHEKGMTLVVSAGNNGENNNWKIISTPADAPGVITVGAMDSNGQKHSISGVGPDFTSYLKPDLACFSDYGTSASAPIITGIIACMLQKDPALTNVRISDLLKRAGHLYPYGNNYVGFGLPDATRIVKLMADDKTNFNRSQELKTNDQKAVIKVGKVKAPVVVFHKTSEFIVADQEVIVPGSKSVRNITQRRN